PDRRGGRPRGGTPGPRARAARGRAPRIGRAGPVGGRRAAHGLGRAGRGLARRRSRRRAGDGPARDGARRRRTRRPRVADRGGDGPVSAETRPGYVIGDDGRYEFDGLASGLWRVEAHDRDAPPTAEVVRLGEGESARVPALRISSGGRIEGTVRDVDGRGLAGL